MRPAIVPTIPAADGPNWADAREAVSRSGYAYGKPGSVMPSTLADCWEAGLTLPQVQEAMSAIGYHRDNLHMLERWERKRTEGRFDPPRRRR